ncbi:MAG TPA: GNAT family N-acetyltransferase [Saprospiraceae bacterium]|nr:GNAT family N-acetyltransferase [Saprospiraceae bacterium]
MNATIEKAQIHELAYAIELVRELAEFEKEPHAVLATLKQYRQAYESGKILIEFAKVETQIVGMILMYETFSTWKGPMLYLEDFYVKPEFRGKGIGKALFEKYIELGKKGGFVKLKWQVLDWNQEAIDFYENFGATIEKGWWNGVMDLK